MVHIIKDENGKTIGWELRPITMEEQKIAGTIRDLVYFGYNDSNIE